jgi:hypothetical protein
MAVSAPGWPVGGLTPRLSGREENRVPSSSVGALAAQLNR